MHFSEQTHPPSLSFLLSLFLIMLTPKCAGGGDLVVGGGDGGAVPPEAMPANKPGTVGNQSFGAGSGTQVGFGNKTVGVAEKSSSLGEPMGS